MSTVVINNHAEYESYFFNSSEWSYSTSPDIELACDIDYSQFVSPKPIGSKTTVTRYRAALDGKGHTISNVSFAVNDSFVGVFGFASAGAQIRNLNFKDCVMTQSDPLDRQIGIVLGGIDFDNIRGNTIVLENITVQNCGLLNMATYSGFVIGAIDCTDCSYYSSGYGVTVRNCIVSDCYMSSYNEGSRYSDSSVGYNGGIIGSIRANADDNADVLIEDCHFEGEVSGFRRDGLFAGFVTDEGMVGHSIVIRDCSAKGTLTSQPLVEPQLSNTVGGFAGCLLGPVVSRCSAEVDLINYSAVTVGLFAGLIRSSAQVDRCYATGTLTSYRDDGDTGLPCHDNLGGFAGAITSTSQVKDCYVNAKMNITDWTSFSGGFCGKLRHDFTVVENCYAVVENPDGNMICGFAGAEKAMMGTEPNQVKAVNCFWDSSVFGSEVVADNEFSVERAQPRNIAQMKTLSTFAGWDFDAIWKMAGYPVFADQEDLQVSTTERSNHMLYKAHCS